MNLKYKTIPDRNPNFNPSVSQELEDIIFSPHIFP